MASKIKITKISEKCFQQKGFDERGCYGCNCNDSCCRYGADFDKEAYELVLKNKDLIEPLIENKIENCFEKQFSNKPDFLGNNSIRSLRGSHGFCIFHNKIGKGCTLYKLVNEKGLSKRILPSICKLFPLSWEDGKLVHYTELKDDNMLNIPTDCNCLDIENKTDKTIFKTQKVEIDDIFELEE